MASVNACGSRGAGPSSLAAWGWRRRWSPSSGCRVPRRPRQGRTAEPDRPIPCGDLLAGHLTGPHAGAGLRRTSDLSRSHHGSAPKGGGTTGSGRPIPSAPRGPCPAPRRDRRPRDTSSRPGGSRRPARSAPWRSIIIVSPIRTCWPASSRPKWTIPVATPVRFTSRTPQTRSSSSLSSASARWLSAAASTARIGSSSWRNREPEDGDDRIADDLLDAPAVRLEDGAHDAEVAVEDLAQRLGIESLAQGGRALQVRSHDGHQPSAVLLGVLHERRATHPAQARAVGVQLAAGGALDDRHGRSLAIVVDCQVMALGGGGQRREAPPPAGPLGS